MPNQTNKKTGIHITDKTVFFGVITVLILTSLAFSLIKVAVPLTIAVAVMGVLFRFLPDAFKNWFGNQSAFFKGASLAITFGGSYALGSALFNAASVVVSAALPWVVLAGGVGLVAYAIKEAFFKSSSAEGRVYQPIQSPVAGDVFRTSRQQANPSQQNKSDIFNIIKNALSGSWLTR